MTAVAGDTNAFVKFDSGIYTQGSRIASFSPLTSGLNSHTATVRAEVGPGVDIVVTPTDDHRSYHVSSARIRRELGFSAERTVRDAIVDLKAAFSAGKIPNAMTDDRYYNIKRMQSLKLR